MPVSTLDTTAALIVVDLQVGSAAGHCVHPFDTVVADAAVLIDAFRDRDPPVVLVNAVGVAPGRTEHPIDLDAMPAGWSELTPELARRPSHVRITKSTWGAFHDTGLAGELRDRGVTQVVVVGHATSFGVESTARAAYAHGFHVTLPTDAMTDVDLLAHENSVRRIFPMLGETGATSDVLALLSDGPTSR